MHNPDPHFQRGWIANAIPQRINERRFVVDRTNADRVAEAEILMDAFHAMTGVDPAPDADGPTTALTDMLAHLRHYADAHSIDFHACLVSGTMHYEAEILEERGEDNDER